MNSIAAVHCKYSRLLETTPLEFKTRMLSLILSNTFINVTTEQIF